MSCDGALTEVDGSPIVAPYDARVALPWLMLAGFLATGLGTLGGIGGAVLLVPALLLGGLAPTEAAPLGLMAVAAGSIAAGASQIDDGVVHHRLGVTVELAASASAIAGALIATTLSADVLERILGGVALIAAAAGFIRRPSAQPAPAGFTAETSGEWPGTLGGTFRIDDGVIAYQASGVQRGLVVMTGAGLAAGLSGTSGGFLKTPAMSHLMGVPVRVAAATTVFIAGLTSSAALVVYAVRGGLDVRQGAAVVIGALAGGRVGAAVQRRIPGKVVGWVLTGLLVAAGLVLLLR